MFHQPMSSPQRTRMFGLSDFAILVSLGAWQVIDPYQAPRAIDREPRAVTARRSTQQHGTEGEQADQGEQDRNRQDWRLHSLPASVRRRGERPASQVATVHRYCQIEMTSARMPHEIKASPRYIGASGRSAAGPRASDAGARRTARWRNRTRSARPRSVPTTSSCARR